MIKLEPIRPEDDEDDAEFIRRCNDLTTMDHVRAKVDWEGFSSAMTEWSFEEVKDKKFHKLKAAYVKAYRALEKYLYEDSE